MNTDWWCPVGDSQAQGAGSATNINNSLHQLNYGLTRKSLAEQKHLNPRPWSTSSKNWTTSSSSEQCEIKQWYSSSFSWRGSGHVSTLISGNEVDILVLILQIVMIDVHRSPYFYWVFPLGKFHWPNSVHCIQLIRPISRSAQYNSAGQLGPLMRQLGSVDETARPNDTTTLCCSNLQHRIS